MDKKEKFTVLGIETSCDETAAAVVVNGKEILSNVVYSQTEIHKQFGGVFPELACRKHLDVLLPVINQALKEAGIGREQIDLISVASHPGLMGALLMGVTCAKTLGYTWNIPVIGVNHIEAHLYAAFMSQLEEIILPAIGLVISGGHTALIRINDFGDYKLIGSTIDDAVGECFDKVAKMLDLPYPGGPEIEKLAKKGSPEKFDFSAGTVKGSPFSFSFSGLKTQVLYTLKGQNSQKNSAPSLPLESYPDVAAGFQNAACQNLVDKTLKAKEQLGISSIVVGGGVANNQFLREKFDKYAGSDTRIFWPSGQLSLDNGAMIAGLGYINYRKNPTPASLSLTPSPTSQDTFLSLFTPAPAPC